MSSLVGAAPPYLFAQAGEFAGPFVFTVPASLEVQPTAATATFDGTGASGDFLACLSFYAQSGQLLSRVYPQTPVTAGDVAQISYAPFPGGLASSGGGYTPPTAHENFAQGTVLGIANGARDQLVFGAGTGPDALFTTNVSNELVALFTGIVTMQIVIYCTGMTAGGTFTGELFMETAGGAFRAQGTSGPSNTGNNSPSLELSVTGLMDANQVIAVDLTNNDGAGVASFLILTAFAQRIT